MERYGAILIAGPTAAGKSALAEAISRAFGLQIVNADSMQVYRDLEILTARPQIPAGENGRYRLYGHVDGADAYSVGRWAADVAAIIRSAAGTGRPPVIVGGTGLYFMALLDGLSPMPSVPTEVRDFWREEAQRLGAAGLHEVLAARDPETAAGLRPADRQRVTRALEVLEASGRGIVHWQRQPKVPVIDAARTLRLVVSTPREELYQRADARLDAMVAGGALDEVEALLRRGLSTDLPVMRAIGVGPFSRVVRGEEALETAVAAAKIETRHYIKRQVTWLRRHMMAWNWLSAQETERNLAGDFTFIGF